MAAGLTPKQIRARIRYRLRKIQVELEHAGVPTLYHRYQLCPMLEEGQDVNQAFNVSFRVLRASNGEVSVLARITVIRSDGVREDYGMTYPAGTFEQGIARIKQLFKTPYHVHPHRKEGK